MYDCDVSSRGETWNVKVNFLHVFPGAVQVLFGDIKSKIAIG
eukprot:13485.XXX_1142601_1142726_1 [CDS] Oithona nana genome sequencing.